MEKCDGAADRGAVDLHVISARENEGECIGKALCRPEGVAVRPSMRRFLERAGAIAGESGASDAHRCMSRRRYRRGGHDGC